MLTPESTRELAAVIRPGANVCGATGALGDISTARLARVLDLREDRVSVQAGITWDALLRALPRGLYPPVLTGFAPASVGGTLSTGGYSKGSHLHGLQIDHVLELVIVTPDGRVVRCSGGELFERALGGLGRAGVIAEATLPLVAHPNALDVEAREVPSSALAEALETKVAYHLTAFGGGNYSFQMFVARPGARVPILDYLAPRPKTWAPSPLQLFLPARALAPFLEVLGPRSARVIPIRRPSPRGALAWPAGELVYGITADAPELLPRALALGAVPYVTRASR